MSLDQKAREALTILFFTILFLAASSTDYEDAVADAQFYCEQVKSKSWPDFKPETNCEE
tara:strand:- start:70 stop:246 length:177 start_codon:yes stop_codon:yes gene_type:complete